MCLVSSPEVRKTPLSPMLRPWRSATVLGLALLLTACGGGEEAPDREADASGAEAGEASEQSVELADPMEIAPGDLCTVPSQETLEEILGDEDVRSDPQATTGRPDPRDLEERDRLRMTCMLVAAAGATLQYDMEIHEGPYVDTTLPDVTEDEADPEIDLGDFAVAGSGLGGDGADVTVVEGQVMVYVSHTVTGGAEQEEMLDGALLVAEELLASVGSS